MWVKIRSAIISATTLALAVGAGIGIGVGLGLDQSDVDPGPTASPAPVPLANASLEIADACDSLLEAYVDRGLDIVSPYGWGGGTVRMFSAQSSDAAGSEEKSTASAPTTVRSTNNETGTNVQENGVDEPDVVKVAGGTLFRIQDNVLTTYDVAGDKPQQLSALQLPDLHNGEILVSGDRVIVLGDLGGTHETTAGARIVVVDASQPGTPRIIKQTDYTAAISAARLHGDVVRVVLDNGLPLLDFRYPDDQSGVNEALERNRELVRETTLGDWLPTITASSASTATTSRCRPCRRRWAPPPSWRSRPRSERLSPPRSRRPPPRPTSPPIGSTSPPALHRPAGGEWSAR